MDRQSRKEFIHRLLLLAGLWWLLVGSDAYSWFLGGPVICLLAAWRLDDNNGWKTRLRPWRLAPFLPFFAWRTLMGSCDVAWRAMHRRLPIAPVLCRYALQLPAGDAGRVFFVNCVNLLPGTLTASWEGDELRVHVLTDGPQVMAELRALEFQVALLFGHPWTDGPEDAPA